MAAQTCTLLGQLPREIRDLIWKDVFRDTSWLISSPLRNQPQRPALLQTCKSIRAEAIKPFHLHAHFRILIHGPEDMLAPVAWLTSVPPRHRRLLQHVTLHFQRPRSHAGWSFAHLQHDPVELCHVLNMQSRQQRDRRKAATLEMLEGLMGLKHFDCGAVRFDLDQWMVLGAAASDSGDEWVQFLDMCLLERKRAFRSASVACIDREWCEMDQDDAGRESGPDCV